MSHGLLGPHPIHNALVQVGGCYLPGPSRKVDIVGVVHLGQVVEGRGLRTKGHTNALAVKRKHELWVDFAPLKACDICGVTVELSFTKEPDRRLDRQQANLTMPFNRKQARPVR